MSVQHQEPSAMTRNDYLLGLVAIGILSADDLPQPGDGDEEYREFVKNGNADDKSYNSYLSLCKELAYWIKQMESSYFDHPSFWNEEVKMRWKDVSNAVSYLEYELGY